MEGCRFVWRMQVILLFHLLHLSTQLQPHNNSYNNSYNNSFNNSYNNSYNNSNNNNNIFNKYVNFFHNDFNNNNKDSHNNNNKILDNNFNNSKSTISTNNNNNIYFDISNNVNNNINLNNSNTSYNNNTNNFIDKISPIQNNFNNHNDPNNNKNNHKTYHNTNHNTNHNTKHNNDHNNTNHYHHKPLSKRSNHHHHYAYTDPVNGFCRSISDCAIGRGLTCLMVYEGCLRGVCTCNGSHSVMEGKRCVPVSYAGGYCTSTSPICAPSLVCVGGVCRCPPYHYLTNDRTRCLKEGTRLVGESCSPPLQASNQQTCLRKIGDSYTSNDVSCSIETSSCQCAQGFKKHLHSCLTRRIGEWGCVTSLQCGGGAVCLDGRCVCPTAYEADDALYKCIRKGALFNLEIGEECDELNERRYCAPGLVCYRCSPQEPDKCIKFLLTERYGTSGCLGRSGRSSNLLLLLLLLFTALHVVMIKG